MSAKPRFHLARSAFSLGLVAVIGTGLLTAVHHLSKDRIAAQERRVVLEQLAQILPHAAFDNQMARVLQRTSVLGINGDNAVFEFCRMGH